VAPALASLGVSCRLEPNHAILRNFFLELSESMGATMGPGTPLEPDALAPDFDPADDDREGWDKIALHLLQRMALALRDLKTPPIKALGRFFGDNDAADYHLFESEDPTGMAAFTEWYCFLYRAKKKSKTVIERFLAEDPAPGLRRLIEARGEGRFSLFKIEAIGPGDEVELRDVLAGPVISVHDQSLAQLGTTNDVVALKVYPAGRFTFCSPAGPFLPAIMAPEAVDWLVSQGLDERAPDPAKSELFGHLFDWLEPAGGPGPEDEDEEPYRAVYAVERPAAVVKALRARGDIHYDEEYNEYVWLEPDQPWLAQPEEPDEIGTIYLESRELTLEVDFPEDLARGRAWLDHLPGLTFLRVEEPPEDEFEDEDDDEPDPDAPPLGPAELAEAQDEVNRFSMEWLDLPNPGLDGKTPRQLCTTPAGRRKIILLIRCLPPPTSAPGIRVPRDAMLRELGLS
jgi:hypothetical protein